MDKVIIFDTTLRDGEQAAGGTLNIPEKLEIARQLEKLNVDVIEAGFPASSPGDFESVKLISEQVRNPVICALSHASPAAIDKAWEAVKGAAHPAYSYFSVFFRHSYLHQLKKSRDEILETSRKMVARAKQYTPDIEFSPMDASRTDIQLSLSNCGSGHRCRGDHGQYSGHGGLCHSQ